VLQPRDGELSLYDGTVAVIEELGFAGGPLIWTCKRDSIRDFDRRRIRSEPSRNELDPKAAYATEHVQVKVSWIACQRMGSS